MNKQTEIIIFLGLMWFVWFGDGFKLPGQSATVNQTTKHCLLSLADIVEADFNRDESKRQFTSKPQVQRFHNLAFSLDLAKFSGSSELNEITRKLQAKSTAFEETAPKSYNAEYVRSWCEFIRQFAKGL